MFPKRLFLRRAVKVLGGFILLFSCTISLLHLLVCCEMKVLNVFSTQVAFRKLDFCTDSKLGAAYLTAFVVALN